MPHTVEAIFFTDRGLPNDEMQVRGVHAAFLKKHGLQASQVPLLKLHNDWLGSAAPFEAVVCSGTM